jgi:hypothetical protein
MKKEQWQKWVWGVLVVCTAILLRPTAAVAASKVEDVNQLKAELEAQKQRQGELEDKINQLEARQKLKERSLSDKIDQVAAQKPPAAEVKKEEKKDGVIPESLQWASKLNISGDLRYRYEYINDDSKDYDRHRNRIRARIGINPKVNDEWSLGFRLATAEGVDAGDPVSTNQTLGGSWGKRPIWLDLAFFDYHPQWLKGLDILGGKIDFPFYRPNKNQLIWDHDLTPEGGAITYGRALTEQTSINLSAGGLWVVERSTAEDTALWGAQGYVKHQINKPTYVLAGASGYWYGNLQGEPALSLQWESPTSNFFGNSSAGGLYASKYDLFELFAEAGTSVGNLPVAVFGDYVVNTAAVNDSEDTGWLVGATLNRAKDPGSWQFEYDYREIKADAVVAQFNDSDFIGGGTGGKGHRFCITYVLTRNVVPAVNYYAAQYWGRNNDKDYGRLQADIMVKF